MEMDGWAVLRIHLVLMNYKLLLYLHANVILESVVAWFHYDVLQAAVDSLHHNIICCCQLFWQEKCMMYSAMILQSQMQQFFLLLHQSQKVVCIYDFFSFSHFAYICYGDAL